MIDHVPVLAQALRDVLDSPVELDDPRLGYLVLQVARADLEAAEAALAALDDDG